MNFIQRLEGLMKNRGIKSFAELERLSGVSTGTIGKWAKNTYRPTVKNLEKIAKCMNVSMDELTDDPDLIGLHVRGIRYWANNTFFFDEETSNIEEHFVELLLSYKLLVNKTCDVRMGKGRSINIEEVKKATVREVSHLMLWILRAPSYFFGMDSSFEEIPTLSDPSVVWKKSDVGENTVIGAKGSAFVQGTNKGSLTVHNGRDASLSEESSELLKLYEGLPLKKRVKLLQTALELSEEND